VPDRDDLSALLPSSRRQALAAAVGRRLTRVERLFSRSLEAFVRDTGRPESEYFSHNCGPAQLHFEEQLTHSLTVWPSQLSIIVLREPLAEQDEHRLVSLSASGPAAPPLAACLGQVCRDVRIWTLREEFPTEEAREVAVSYRLAGDVELFYSIYLHGDLDNDYLLLGADVPRDRVDTCVSLAQGAHIDRRGLP
jgi:hypothetical protein